MNTGLVTGSSGFIGQYIVKELKNHDWNVIGLDRHEIESSQIRSLLDNHIVLRLPSDSLGLLLKQYKPDYIIHTASPSNVQNSLIDPYFDFKGSADVLFHLLDTMRRYCPESRLIYLSSAAVYGNPECLPVSEDVPLKPLSPYGYHKVICEEIIGEFFETYGVPGCSVRIFSAYGSGLKRQILWDICKKALEQPVIELFGTGQETRDFIHASDIARGIRLIAERSDFQNNVYNMASGVESSISSLAKLIVDRLGTETDIVFRGSLRKGDPVQWKGDISRLSQLGFTVQVEFEDGVKRYVDWAQSEIVTTPQE
jgi:UDP-glucose 4-epimerase